MTNRTYLAIAVLITGFSILAAGCSKKESPIAETSSAKEKDKGHDENGVVMLSTEKLKNSGVETEKVTFETISGSISATAVIELNSDKTSKISARVSGKASKLIASQGDRVKAGQTLALMDSIEMDQIWSDYIKTTGRVELAQKNLQREETLYEKRVSPEKDVLRARQELSEAEADLTLVKEKFRLVGIDTKFLEAKSGDGPHPLIPIISPISGVVIEKTVTQGESISPERTLFTVADLSSLWVIIDIYEKDIAHLGAGPSVDLSVGSHHDKVFRGRLSYVSDLVDEKTRTVKTRVTIDNSNGDLKPGMFATVTIDTKSGQLEKLIAVPEGAIQIEGTSRYVFVQEAPGKFRTRNVTLGRQIGGKVEITDGLREGETITVKGAFTLKSELKKESLEAE
jgi:cobalt-zinc-cadmium efflux system membrane fusion protein